VGRKLNGKASSINVVSEIITTIIVTKINLFMIILQITIQFGDRHQNPP